MSGERLLRYLLPERVVPLGAIALLIAASWAWLVYQDWTMAHMDMADMAMPAPRAWGAADLWLAFAMWAIMMAGMMLPSVTPVVLLYRRAAPARDATAPPDVLTLLFVAGYLVSWTAFSAVATVLQWGLHTAAAISPSMRVTNPLAAGAVLVLAGVYQWSPLKRACLAHCRSPLAFLLNEWRSGPLGALAMGARHGLYCTGCCWLLMTILLVVGVMNLAWVAVLALFVLAEKLLPGGERVGRVAGALLVAWGAWLSLS